MHTRRYAKGNLRLKKGEYQRSGNTFEYKWTDANGRRQSISAKTLSELRKKEDEIYKDALDGYDYTEQDATINQYYDLWKKIKSGIRDSTFKSYTRVYQRYIEPSFGKTKLRHLSYSKIVLFLKSLAVDPGLGIGTIKKVHQVLGMILEVAVKDGVLRNNPCHGALKELQKEHADDVKQVCALTIDEQRLFEEFLSRPGRYNRWYPVFIVMLWTGMRVGEVIGLQWEDIDFDNNQIHVEHTLEYYDIGLDEGSTYAMNPPKTKNSIRVVPMLPIVKEAFFLEKERQEAFGIKCEVNIDGFSNFVFLNDHGGVHSHKRLNYRLKTIRKAINAYIAKSGNEYGIKEFPHVHNHMLRHTFATRMREAGTDIKATASILGHNDIAITLYTYTDASQEFKSREISVLDDYYRHNAG